MHTRSYTTRAAQNGKRGALRLLSQRQAFTTSSTQFDEYDERWQRAEDFANRHDAGETYKSIQAGWINERTGQPYSITYVIRYIQTWHCYGHDAPEHRPTFGQAYVRAEGTPIPKPQRTVNGHVKRKTQRTQSQTRRSRQIATVVSKQECERLDAFTEQHGISRSELLYRTVLACIDGTQAMAPIAAPIAAPTTLSPERHQQLLDTVIELGQWCLARADEADNPVAMHQALTAYSHLLRLKSFYTESN